MKKVDILTRMEQAGVIAVLRGQSKDKAKKAAQAIIAGGIKSIEVTFTVPDAELIIKDLVTEYEADKTTVIGAGTVLDVTTARLAIMSGAEYIVSPSFDRTIAELCNLYQIPYLPGCMTVTEMQEALKSGVDIIKLFPGNVFGSDCIKSFKAPMPQLNIMPSGGVDLGNIRDWFEAGAVMVGVGGHLLKPLETDEFNKITEIAERYINAFNEIKGGKNG